MILLRVWLPPLAWIGAIFWFSTDTFSASATGSVLVPLLRWLSPGIGPSQLAVIHHLVRKGAHLTVYGILALLLLKALQGGRLLPCRMRCAAGALAIVAACALLDEYHQSFTASRTASLYDSLIDLGGGSVALVLLALRCRVPSAAHRS